MKHAGGNKTRRKLMTTSLRIEICFLKEVCGELAKPLSPKDAAFSRIVADAMLTVKRDSSWHGRRARVRRRIRNFGQRKKTQAGRPCHGLLLPAGHSFVITGFAECSKLHDEHADGCH